MPKLPVQKGPIFSGSTFQGFPSQADTAPSKQQLDQLISMFTQGRVQDALALARNLASKFPRHFFFPYMIGNALAALGKSTEALASFEKAVSLKPDYADAYNNMANLLNQAGKHEAAMEKCHKALKIRPDFVEALNILGNAQFALGRHQEAISSYQKAIKLRPSYALAHNGLSMAFKDSGQPEKAIASAQAALDIRPEFAEALNNLGNAYLAMEEVEDAIASLCKALDLRPDFVEALNNLGSAYNALGQYDEAVSCLSKALSGRPDFVPTHLNLLKSYNGLEQYATALASGRRALELDPESVDAMIAIASSYSAIGVIEPAREMAEKAIERSPRNAEFHRVLAEILDKSGHQDKATKHHELANELAPSTIRSQLSLGNRLMQQGQLNAAEAVYEEIIHQSDDNLGARLGLAAVRKTKEGDENFGRLLEMAQKIEDMPESNAIRLHFSLGKGYDEIGQYDLAFHHFYEGGRLKRKRGEHDVARFDKLADDIRGLFTERWIGEFRGLGFSSKLPIFVLGMPRSGTTLTETILASHPLVMGGGELQDFGLLAKRPHGNATEPYPFSLAGITGDDLAFLGGRYAAGLHRRGPDKERITDKMPANYTYLGLIHLALPGAKIIHVRRDPVDTCLSNFMQLFQVGQYYSYDLYELGRFYRSYAKIMEHWRGVLPPGAFHDIDYEEVVASPEQEIRKLLRFCELEWNDACLNFHETKRNVRTASVTQVRQPMYKSSLKKWKRYEKHLGPLFDGLGDLVPTS
jgi:tetratricopeptide (TPR) repeat protein